MGFDEIVLQYPFKLLNKYVLFLFLVTKLPYTTTEKVHYILKRVYRCVQHILSLFSYFSSLSLRHDSTKALIFPLHLHPYLFMPDACFITFPKCSETDFECRRVIQ